MATSPLITFKAGRCTRSNKTITADPTPGYLYLYSEDELIHLCWRPRSSPSTDPEIDLIIVPGDATFTPLVKEPGAEDVRSPTNGRIFVLRFSDSGEKSFFWMQSRSQHREGEADWFSQRDQRLGQIVDLILSGEEVDVEREVAEIRQANGGGGGGGDGANGSGGGGGGGEDLMDLDRQETGGAGADATGGDPREEGEASREGGADGGRAASSGPQDTSALVQNFLNSISGSSNATQAQNQTRGADKPFTTLPDLLATSTTIPYVNALTSDQEVDNICTLLPPELFLLAQESSSDSSSADPNPTPAAAQAAIEALSLDQKKAILKQVFRSPQLQQSLGSLTVALRDGGVPMIGEALELKVRNGGLIRGGQVPLGGGEAVEAFVEAFKGKVEEEEKKNEGQGERDGK